MNKKLIIGLTIAVIIGVGAYAFGHQGQRYGYHNWMHGGSGMHHGYPGGSGYEYPGNLNEQEIKAWDEQRFAFLKDTENLRRDLYAKELELRSELIKDNPDATKAGALQKDISDLESKLDQKRIDHMINMRKLNSNAGREFMGGYHMGYGNFPSNPCW